ncbi:macro domain-containing protein [Salibacterium halotolerans]|uniref:O-acetyl-ADP-ribose deacetylase (Regulator of RNase III), contains Macro domain n=1 Tax=Salibacterium halotolerans TaxID=1884432 RepID=A0A1I5XTZ7_9BACI|nr:macro domain-containing protein [Salibacterium halotolerans]SFQ35451.1 O-acetyl-ADP-ribose deacetylase (regulator of RNase III), contains Macro domain [Salibacterium halotolerans]
MKGQIHGVQLECVQGDIAAQEDVEAVVNAANAALQTGGGVAGALHRAAGSELAEAGAALAPIEPGEAVTTDAFHLPNKYVIHCLGPVYGRDKPEEELLRACYRNALKQAEEKNIRSIAFPSISTGAFGYPAGEAAAAAMEEVISQAPYLKSVQMIRFVLFRYEDWKAYDTAWKQAD